MIDHISIGVRDLQRAKRFYDAVLGALGYRLLRTGQGTLGYGDDDATFWVVESPRPISPDKGSGLHICFIAPSQAAVAAFHRSAIAAGGGDNGPPGYRPQYGPDYYAAFVIDPDGYRLEAYFGPRG
jgi:catechol 2,3-dioxygenase-like lactoylglutathione lyase family enzyme